MTVVDMDTSPIKKLMSAIPGNTVNERRRDMKRVRYCGSKIWSYEKETFTDDDPIYTLFCGNMQVGECPSLGFMKDVIKYANEKAKTIEGKARLAKEYLYSL